MAIPPSRVVVVGCGDHLASDAAAGLEVAAMLRRVPVRSCEVRELDLCSPAFISELSSDTKLVFVQGVFSSAPAGSIHILRLDQQGVASGSSSAGLRVWQEIRNLLALASRLPQVYLMGIEMERSDAGIGLSNSVHAAVLEVVRTLTNLNEKGQPKLPFSIET